MRKIVSWKGPAATFVVLECGHEVHTDAAHATRCADCGAQERDGDSGRRGKRGGTRR